MPKLTKTQRQPKVVSGEGYCRKCQKTMRLNKFYEATNPMLDSNNFMSICKDCANEIYNYYFTIYNNMEKALQLTCQDLDVRFSVKAMEQVQTHIEKLKSTGKSADAVFGYYKSKLSSLSRNNEGIDNFRFRDSDILNNSLPVINQNDFIDSDFEVTEDSIRFWGINLDKHEYEYLSAKLEEYLNTYECDTPVMEELLKQAAYESLEIRNKRQKKEDVSKNLKNLQEILGTANIKPNQETGANATEQATLGLLIKKWETEEPVPEPDPEWKDVDGIGKLIRVFFLGHLCKIMGINNECSKEYEEEMEKLRVNLPDNTINDDLEEGI
jgi:hypothetical protein